MQLLLLLSGQYVTTACIQDLNFISTA